MYVAAVKAFQMMFQRRTQVSRVYLRNGMAESTWIPGLSDIDLTVILRGGLSEQQEYDFLIFFWRACRALRLCFPMLGEVDILSEDDTEPFLATSSITPEKRWTLLSGRGDVTVAFDGDSGWRRRALNHAVCVYLDYFLPCLVASDSLTYRDDLERRARKIFRVLQPIFTEAGRAAKYLRSANPIDLMADVLGMLEQAVSLVAIESGTIPSPSGREFRPSQGCRSSASSPHFQNVRSVLILNSKTVWMILQDGLEAGEMSRTIAPCRESLGKRYAAPVVAVPFSLFSHMVRDYYPYDYSNFQRGGTVDSGIAPLADIAPPDQANFVNFAMACVPNALKLVRSEELFVSAKGKTMASVERELNRSLCAQLLLRGDWTSPHWKEVVTQCRAEFPECFHALDEIKRNQEAGRGEAARKALFRLFRSVSCSLQELLRTACTNQLLSRASAV